jgi:Family of unknown function (DUF5706)
VPHSVTVVDVATEGLWRCLEQVNEWVRFADAKATAVLTADSVLFGALALHGSGHGFSDSPVSSALTILGLSLAAASFVVGILVVLPRTSVPAAPPSLLYFSDVAAHFAARPADYVEQARALAADEQRLADALAGQVWANAVVGSRKFRRVGLSIWLLLGATMATGLSVVVQRFGG